MKFLQDYVYQNYSYQLIFEYVIHTFRNKMWMLNLSTSNFKCTYNPVHMLNASTLQ